MSDEIDQANELAELNLQVALQNRKETYTIKPIGYCHNPLCELEFEDGSMKLFCNDSCAKTYDKTRRK